MAIDIEHLAAQIFVQTVSPDIMVRVSQGANLDKMFKSAAAQAILAAEEFARACNAQTTPAAVPVA